MKDQKPKFKVGDTVYYYFNGEPDVLLIGDVDSSRINDMPLYWCTEDVVCVAEERLFPTKEDLKNHLIKQIDEL